MFRPEALKVSLDKCEVRMLQCEHILNWVDAHANLPPWARWIAKADVAPERATKRVTRRPSLNGGCFVF